MDGGRRLYADYTGRSRPEVKSHSYRGQKEIEQKRALDVSRRSLRHLDSETALVIATLTDRGLKYL